MSELSPGGLSAIGIDWKALLFQVVNFVILLWLLKRFAYRPLTKLLEARRQKIEESLRSADAIDRQKTALEEDRRTVLREAQQAAQEIISRSKQERAALLQAAQEKGEHHARLIEEQATSRAAQAAQQLRTSLKAETLQLVKRATEKLLRQKLDAQADTQLIAQTIKEFSSS